VVPIDNPEMDRIERAVAKYKPLDISRPKKTMLQKQPMDFANIENHEVYVVDLVTGLPASSYVLQQELRNALNCPEKYIVVRAANEPVELESEKLDAEREMDAEAKDMKRGARLSTDPNYDLDEQGESGENYYGNAYNVKLLDYLRKVQQSRASDKKEPANPLFTWLEMPKESGDPKQVEGDFNAGIGGVKPASTRSVSQASDPSKVHSRSNQGNFDDATKTYSRKYADASGKSKVLKRTVSTEKET
jgi:hypothetical protein